MIQTIADLQTHTADEIEKARKSIDFKGLALNAIKKMGQRPGYTFEEWEEKKASLKPETCSTCNGRGTVMPKLRTVGTIHASSATKCVAALYYDVTGEIAPKVELSTELLITFGIGTAIHEVVQAALSLALEDRFRDEVRIDVPDALICDGSVDGEAYFPLCRSGLEIKTISENEFTKLRKPKPDHVVQAGALYSKGLDVPFMSYLYISKGWPHPMKEYVKVYDDSVFTKWYLEKGIKVEDALEEGKPPVADASPYECKGCGYSHECPQALGIRDRFRRR